MTFKTSQTMAAVVALVIHIVVAAFLFSVITAAAVALNIVTNYCETGALAPTWAIQGMRGLEMLLWASDAVCFVLLLLVEVWKFCVTVWKEREA